MFERYRIWQETKTLTLLSLSQLLNTPWCFKVGLQPRGERDLSKGLGSRAADRTDHEKDVSKRGGTGKLSSPPRRIRVLVGCKAAFSFADNVVMLIIECDSPRCRATPVPASPLIPSFQERRVSVQHLSHVGMSSLKLLPRLCVSDLFCSALRRAVYAGLTCYSARHRVEMWGGESSRLRKGTWYGHLRSSVAPGLIRHREQLLLVSCAWLVGIQILRARRHGVPLGNFRCERHVQLGVGLVGSEETGLVSQLSGPVRYPGVVHASIQDVNMPSPLFDCDYVPSSACCCDAGISRCRYVAVMTRCSYLAEHT
jgi:hypothetical protein